MAKMVNFVIVFSQQQQKTGKTLKLLSLCYAASLLMGSRVIFQTQKMGFDRAVKTQEVSHPKKPLEKKKKMVRIIICTRNTTSIFCFVKY